MFLNEPYWTYDVICIPTMHRMDDVIIYILQACINNCYIPTWLGGWVKFGYIPTWFGDWCMYESLVIGRSYSHSWVIKSCYSFKNIFTDFACSQGEHGWYSASQHVKGGSLIREFSMCLGGAWSMFIFIYSDMEVLI